MWRILTPLPLFTLTASASLPDPIKAGTVLATLDPGQAALFTAIFIAVLAGAMVIALVVALIKSQSAVAVVAERFQSAASKLAEATTTQDTQHAVQLALLQQGQANISHTLAELTSLIRARS